MKTRIKRSTWKPGQKSKIDIGKRNVKLFQGASLYDFQIVPKEIQYQSRYVIMKDGKVVDDCRGFGYRSKVKAYNSLK